MRSGCAWIHDKSAAARCLSQCESQLFVGVQFSAKSPKPSQDARKGNEPASSDFFRPSSHLPDQRSQANGVNTTLHSGFSPKIVAAVCTARLKDDTTNNSQLAKFACARNARAWFL